MDEGQIYYIYNSVNNLGYVGQVVKYRNKQKKSVEFGYLKRFQEHLSSSNQKKLSVLAKAIIDLGKNVWSIKLLETCGCDQLDEKERHWIDVKKTLYPNGYNILYGPPYAYNEDARKKISDTLKKFWESQYVRDTYSKSHRNKFKVINQDNINMININPIKENNEFKIVYMYIIYKDTTSYRRRYGGKHEDYDDAFNRCYIDALNLCNNDVARITFKKDRNQEILDKITEQINHCDIVLHKMGINQLVAVYIATLEKQPRSNQKRYVFGGKTISVKEAFDRALSFTSKLTNKINISSSLQHYQIVREVPKAISTKDYIKMQSIF